MIQAKEGGSDNNYREMPLNCSDIGMYSDISIERGNGLTNEDLQRTNVCLAPKVIPLQAS